MLGNHKKEPENQVNLDIVINGNRKELN